MKLTKSKPLVQNQASRTVSHGEINKGGRLRRLAKFVKDTTKHFHKHNIAHDKCESTEIATTEPSQIENSLVDTADTIEFSADQQECQRSIFYPTTLDTPAQSATIVDSHDYINNTDITDIYENEVHLQLELQSHTAAVHCQASCNNSIVATGFNDELTGPTVRQYTAPDSFVPVTGHTRQISTSSTLPVSLRSHISEPVLRDKYLKPSFLPPVFKSLSELLVEFKGQQIENSWKFLLDSRQTSHDNELADFRDEHEHEVKYLKEDLEKVTKRKDYFEARLKKEVQLRDKIKATLAAIKEQHHHESISYEERIRQMTKDNLELIAVTSSMASNETNLKAELSAKENELELIRNHLREVLVKAKEEADHSQIKIQNLQYALEGTPMADDVDVKGHLQLKKQQVQDLSDRVVELSNELERAEAEAFRQQREVDRVVEKYKKDAKYSSAVEAHLRSLLKIADSHKNDYLLMLNADSNIPEDVRLQAANKVLATFSKEMSWVIIEKAKTDVALAAAEDSRLALEYLYRDLQADLKKKDKEIEDLKNKNEALNGDKGYLDAELSIAIEERQQEIQGRDQAVLDYQGVVRALHQYIDNLGGMEADARTAGVWNAKVTEVDHLNESLKQAQLIILENEERQHERQCIESLDTCLASNYDEVTRQQAKQLNTVTEESTRLRLIVEELIEAQEAHDCKATIRESEVAQQQHGRDNCLCDKEYVEWDSLLEVPPAADQTTRAHGFDDWDEVDSFLHAAADNIRRDATLLNLVADYQAKIKRLRRTITMPIMMDTETVERVQKERLVIRRVHRENNLFAIYQRIATKGKSKTGEAPVTRLPHT
ncbi:hypothetical protein MMC11_006401 [Xylographa trunciseda]|nr:hypothetical protein [Xylographa trunciseda]